MAEGVLNSVLNILFEIILIPFYIIKFLLGLVKITIESIISLFAVVLGFIFSILSYPFK